MSFRINNNTTPPVSLLTSPRSVKLTGLCRNCSFSFRLISAIEKFCSKDCKTCYEFSNKSSLINETPAHRVVYPAGGDESKLISEIQKNKESVYQFEIAVARQDEKDHKVNLKYHIVMEKDMEKYFKPKQQKVQLVRRNFMEQGVHRGKLWGL